MYYLDRLDALLLAQALTKTDQDMQLPYFLSLVRNQHVWRLGTPQITPRILQLLQTKDNHSDLLSALGIDPKFVRPQAQANPKQRPSLCLSIAGNAEGATIFEVRASKDLFDGNGEPNHWHSCSIPFLWVA